MHNSKESLRTGISALILAVMMLLGGAASAADASTPRAMPTSTPAASDSTPAASTADSAQKLPQTIPSLDGFKPASSGRWELSANTRVMTNAADATRAKFFASELSTLAHTKLTFGTAAELINTDAALSSADPWLTSTDILLDLDSTRTDLGEEGFELSIRSSSAAQSQALTQPQPQPQANALDANAGLIRAGLTITAATDAGIFYGTRAVSQMLRQLSRSHQTLALPSGEVTSVPKYAERGVILCACQINISPEWIDQFLDNLADLRINQVLMELKVKSEAYPDTNTFGYYTKDDVRRFVEKAKTYNIDVVPEINSPGHMNVWLENSPQFQLVDKDGNYMPNMLDISKPSARTLAKDLIDEYDDVFESKYWHMGADEYTIGTNYSRFPQLTKYAQDAFGKRATAYDAFNAFINEINAHVKSKGKQLRVFNDGVMRSSAQKINRDVVVDYWAYRYFYTPGQFVDDGYKLMNTTQSLYWSRDNIYGVDVEGLYDSGWNVGTFDGGTQIDPDYRGLLGARVSIWPDASFMTENEVQMQTAQSLAFLAQATWSATRPWPTWSGANGMQAAIEAIGEPIVRSKVASTELPNGAYVIPELADVGAGPWQFVATYDGYYQVTDLATNKCLSVNPKAAQHLSVVTQVGAPAALVPCDDPATHYTERTSAQLPHQKWQVVRHVRDGQVRYSLRNAITVQYLARADGTEKHPDLQGIQAEQVRANEELLAATLSGSGKTPELGTVAQFPHDLVEINQSEGKPTLKSNALFTLELDPTISVKPVRVHPAKEVTQGPDLLLLGAGGAALTALIAGTTVYVMRRRRRR